MRTTVFLIAVLAAGPVAAQSVMVFGGNGQNYFDWPSIEKCAVEVINSPTVDSDGGHSMLSPEWQKYEGDFQRISACRLSLIARHEGWKAAGGKEPDPFPPQPYVNPGDFASMKSHP